jgi:Hemerythrin HHE cation binding domain
MADIIDMILSDHQQIRSLTARLARVHRHPPQFRPGCAVGGLWDQLADLLDMHTRAEEEICFLPMFSSGRPGAGRLDDAVAEHADIREAAEEARLQPAGSALWWLAVNSALSACADHLNREEIGVLAAFASRADPALRQAMGRQWSAFRAAWTLDAASGLLTTTLTAQPAGPAIGR